MFDVSRHLSARDRAILTFIDRLHQVTSGQLERLAFNDGSPVSQGRRQRKAMLRLVKWGMVRRMQRPVGGYAGGSGQSIYTPARARDRMPNPHTLDIAELFVRLVEQERTGRIKIEASDPEPYSHIQLGNLIYKPDFRVHIKTATGDYVYMGELDRGTEYRTQLGEKMRRAVNAYHRWPRSDNAADDTFPQVLWIVPDDQRLRFVQTVIRRQEEPLFAVCRFDQAIDRLSR